MIYWFIDFNSLILLISGVTGDLWWSIDLHFNGHCWMIYLFLLLVSMAGWLVHITVLLHIVVCPLLLHIPWLVGSTLMGFMPILLYALLLVGSILLCLILHIPCLMPYCWLVLYCLHCLIAMWCSWWFMPILVVYAHIAGVCCYVAVVAALWFHSLMGAYVWVMSVIPSWSHLCALYSIDEKISNLRISTASGN